MSSPPKKRSRLATGCQRCRARHLKCDLSMSACNHCKLANVSCERGFNVRFRNGLTLDDDPAVSFPESEIWPRPVGSLQFCDETSEIESFYRIVYSSETERPHNGPVDDIVYSSPSYVSPEQVGVSRPHELQTSRVSLDTNKQPLGVLHHPMSSPPRNDHLSLNRSLLSIEDGQGKLSRTPTSFNKREATLMRNYVENMALWADITDRERHFEVEVPLRAVQDPVLCFAIFAFSSRHINRQRKSEAAEALQYHNRCLQLLIPVLSGARDSITDTVLATVAILRQHEEMDSEDNQFHLTGVTHILNTVSTFGSSGGLGEAAAWLCLREEIHISITSQKLLRTDLENFRNSNVFLRNDDFSWACQMVFLLAKLLKCAFGYGSEHLALLQRVSEEIEHWYTAKPQTFEPIHYTPRSREGPDRFPGLWMLLPVHVIGVQYYHIAKIILAFSCPTPSPAYEVFKNPRYIEKTARNHLLTVLGLAKSNAKAENTLFTARHSLVAWGWVLRHKSDQEAAEGLLIDMEKRTGWDVAPSIQSLRGQWYEEYSDE